MRHIFIFCRLTLVILSYLPFGAMASTPNLNPLVTDGKRYDLSDSIINKNILPNQIYELAIVKLKTHQSSGIPNDLSTAQNYFNEAKQLLIANKNEAAIAGFLVAASIHKTTREAALINTGLGLYNLKKYSAAIYYYKLAIQENQNSYEAWLNMGAAAKYVKDDYGRSNEAEYLKKAYELRPTAHKAIYNYATTLMSQDNRPRNEKAIKLLQEALIADPDNPTYLWALGKAYNNISFAGNKLQAIPWYHKSITYYDMAISKDKAFQEAYLSKGRAYLNLYHSVTKPDERRNYMDSLNRCYADFKAIGGVDKTGLFSQNAFNYPPDQKTVASFDALVPSGWKIRSKVSDDFNYDGNPDFAMVIQLNDPQKIKQIIKYNVPGNPPGQLNVNPSILYVALYNKTSGKYDVVATNTDFYEVATGYEDYVYELSSSKGVIKLVRKWNPTRPYTFLFRYQNNKFEMIGREINTLRETGDHYKEHYSINYSTKKLIYTITNLKTQTTSKFEYSNIEEPYPGDIENIRETINIDNNPYMKNKSEVVYIQH